MDASPLIAMSCFNHPQHAIGAARLERKVRRRPEPAGAWRPQTRIQTRVPLRSPQAFRAAA
jgi:hypothetical protein